jgi:Uma2 family endonuclease
MLASGVSRLDFVSPNRHDCASRGGKIMPRTETELLSAELYNGDRMTQKEFHRIYEQTPKDFKAELIGGIVYVASPLKRQHARSHLYLGAVFAAYEDNTPGVEAGDNATVILSADNEPQPDLFLRVLPEFGGQSRTSKKDYVRGAPELFAEIAHSSRAIDLHAKKQEYAQHGGLEYIVVCLRERQIRWFDLSSGEEFVADAKGVFRSRIFPGLWLHGEALLAKDYKRLMATLEQGLASEEHAAFVRQLESRRKGKRKERRD